MLRPEFVRRKLALIAEDLERLAGMRDVLVISTPSDTPRFEELLRDDRRIDEYAR